MPAKISPGLGLTYGWVRGEDFWGGPQNDTIITLDTLINSVVQSTTYASPPAEALEGWQYVIATNATGVWSGQDGKLTVLIEGAWRFFTPKLGWRAWNVALEAFIYFNGTTWIEELTGIDPEKPEVDPNLKPKAYDIAVTVSEDLLNSEAIVHLPILEAMILPANMADSVYDTISGSIGFAQFVVQRNGTNVGSITVEKDEYGATFSTVGGNAVRFSKGDRLTIRAPAIAVEGLKDFGFVIRFIFA